jgi:hypothetical protein
VEEEEAATAAATKLSRRTLVNVVACALRFAFFGLQFLSVDADIQICHYLYFVYFLGGIYASECNKPMVYN